MMNFAKALRLMSELKQHQDINLGFAEYLKEEECLYILEVLLENTSILQSTSLKDFLDNYTSQKKEPSKKIDKVLLPQINKSPLACKEKLFECLLDYTSAMTFALITPMESELKKRAEDWTNALLFECAESDWLDTLIQCISIWKEYSEPIKPESNWNITKAQYKQIFPILFDKRVRKKKERCKLALDKMQELKTDIPKYNDFKEVFGEETICKSEYNALLLEKDLAYLRR